MAFTVGVIKKLLQITYLFLQITYLFISFDIIFSHYLIIFVGQIWKNLPTQIDKETPKCKFRVFYFPVCFSSSERRRIKHEKYPVRILQLMKYNVFP